jgi:uncharacterized membrane protein YjfL (UPF0719 family)
VSVLESLGYAVVYSAVGVALLIVGFVALDLLTPGKLAHHVYQEQSINAAVVSSSGLLGLAGVVFTAIWTNADSGFGDALGWTAAFGLLGVVLQSIVFVVLDLLTPGRLGDFVTKVAFHPGSLLVAAGQIAVSLIVIASIA